MEFKGQYLIPALPETVWSALNDPEILRQCVPGCEAIEKTDPTHFDATAVLKVGPVKATFKASLALENLDPPHSCTIRGEGQGGVAGFARGDARVVLAPGPGGTLLTYSANAAIGGKLAQIGQRLIDGAAKQIADDFFTRFGAAVAAIPAAEAPPEPEVADVTVSPEIPEEPAVREGLTSPVWVVGLIALIAALLVLYGVVLGG